jgi:hypothetical protein
MLIGTRLMAVSPWRLAVTMTSLNSESLFWPCSSAETGNAAPSAAVHRKKRATILTIIPPSFDSPIVARGALMESCYKWKAGFHCGTLAPKIRVLRSKR